MKTETEHAHNEETTEYDLNYHLNITSVEMQKAVQELRAKILELSSVEENVAQKTGITYRTTKSFTRFEFRGTWIQVLVRDSSYPEDTQKEIKDITSYQYGYRGLIKFTPQSNIDYIFSLVKASYSSTL